MNFLFIINNEMYLNVYGPVPDHLENERYSVINSTYIFYGIGEYKYRDITFNEIKSLNVDFNYIIENVTIGDIIQKHIRYLRRKKLKEIERKLY